MMVELVKIFVFYVVAPCKKVPRHENCRQKAVYSFFYVVAWWIWILIDRQTAQQTGLDLSSIQYISKGIKSAVSIHAYVVI